jgi:hypothetical protein
LSKDHDRSRRRSELVTEATPYVPNEDDVCIVSAMIAIRLVEIPEYDVYHL